MSKNNFATCYPMSKNAAKTARLSVLSQTFQNDMFLSKYILTFLTFLGRRVERSPINFKNLHFQKWQNLHFSNTANISKFRPVLKYVVFHAEFESKLRFA